MSVDSGILHIVELMESGTNPSKLEMNYIGMMKYQVWNVEKNPELAGI